MQCMTFALLLLCESQWPVTFVPQASRDMDGGNTLTYWSYFTSGWILTTSFGIPCILAHSNVIAIWNCSELPFLSHPTSQMFSRFQMSVPPHKVHITRYLSPKLQDLGTLSAACACASSCLMCTFRSVEQCFGHAENLSPDKEAIVCVHPCCASRI